MIANYHTHTWRCNHAVGREEDYVKTAIDQGFRILGFSDHSPYFFPGSYYSGIRMYPEQLKDYCDTVLSLRKQYGDRIRIPLGLELEYYPDCLPELLPFLKDHGIEYLLLGQHFLHNEVNSPYSGRATSDTGILALNVNGDSRINTFDALGIVEKFVSGSEYAVVTKAASITTKQ